MFNFIEIEKPYTIPSGLVADLLSEKITGIIFKKFLNQDEIQKVRDGFYNNIPTHQKTKINDGFTSYPISFAQFTQAKKHGTMNIEEYTLIASNLISTQEEVFGLNILEKISNFLCSLECFEHVQPIFNKEHNKYLVPFNFRELLPGNGELIIHCENLFFNEFPDFFNWLNVMDVKDNKLSYFIPLQNTELGGELCCFDLNWKNVKHRETPHVLKDATFNDIDIEDTTAVKRKFVKPDEGDLLLFAGGNVWHRVEKVRGIKSRITLGGFIAETYTEGEYCIWS